MNAYTMKKQIEAKLDEVVRIASRAKAENRSYTDEEEKKVTQLNDEIERDKPVYDSLIANIKSRAAVAGSEKIHSKLRDSDEHTVRTQKASSVFASSDAAHDAGEGDFRDG